MHIEIYMERKSIYMLYLSYIFIIIILTSIIIIFLFFCSFIGMKKHDYLDSFGARRTSAH